MKFLYQVKHFSWRQVLFGAVLLGWIFAVNAAAATYSVTTTADSGAGSLRQAIAEANGTPAADTINFNVPLTDPNCSASGVCAITLTGDVITVQATGGSLTVANQMGAGKLLISGNDASRVFEVGEGANLTLDNLTITRGVGSIVSGPQGGIFGVVRNFRGTLTIMNSVFVQNSGGIVISTEAFGNSGVLNVLNTSVSDNAGVGIYFTNSLSSGGTANIVNSTISNNAAAGAGGGNGGGIYFLGSQLRITNSTISGNSNSQGGGIFAAVAPGTSATGLILLTNSTITANSATSGGGIHVFQANIKLRNTIVAGNTSSAGTPDFNFQFGSATSLGNNLIGNSTNTGSPNGQWLASDILNQDARLPPLADNGGLTKTHALLPDSPAINRGNNCVLTANGCGDNNPAVPTDQRGVSRAGAVDIGAFEYVPRVAFDFDGDGRADQTVFRPADGIWYLLNSSSGFSAAQFGLSSDKIVPADFDGDGRTDIAVFRDGVWYWLNSSDGGFNAVQFGQAGDVPVPFNYTGDGRAELTIYRAGVWFTLNLTNNQFQAVQFGVASDKPVPADYDGDGKTDFAVVRQTGGASIWYILGTSRGFYGLQFGTDTDTLVPADYDGDGKTDVAVYRSGIWYILGSTHGIQFGIASDIPVAADYDGDGKADVAVYRDGIWYLMRSQQGFAAVQFGTTNDKPIPAAYVP